MSDTDEKILKAVTELTQKVDRMEAGQQVLREDQKQGFTEVNKRLDRLEDHAVHVTTALKAVPTKQDLEVTVEAAKSELKADLIRKIQRHERRIDNLEDEAGIENPEKN